MSIGQNVKRLRLEKNLSQNELSAAVSISQAMLAQIERGTKSMSLELAKEISGVLQCDVNDFYK